MVEWITCAIILVCNLVMATEWAKYGLWQISIQRPLNTRALGAAFVGTAAVLLSGLLQKYGQVEFKFLTEQNYWSPAVVFLGIPFGWLFLFRCVFMPKGLFDYNRATIRTTFWALQNYRPGQQLESEAESLSNFPLAQRTLELFQKSISAQEKGDLSVGRQRVVDLETADIAYDQTVNVPCPSCGLTTKVPCHAPNGVTGNCVYCGTMLTAKSIGTKLYVNSYGKSMSSRQVTPLNRKNIATAHEEKALLYRMMNQFDKAHQALGQAQAITDGLLASDPHNKDYLQLKSLILFRQAEAYQAQGSQNQQARELYQQCQTIDREIGSNEGDELVQRLLSQLI